VLNQFVQAGALDELHLTLTPWLLGGRDTASLMGTAQPGLCLKDFMGQQPLTLLSSQAVGNEVFLTYQLQRQAFS
jgi:riboflavin biosynthesis pyrimidine reductase